MKPRIGNLKLSPRRELRLALFAAMETCWTYAVLAILAAGIGARPISALVIFVAYWVAILAGRLVPRAKWHRVVLQIFAMTVALVAILAVARIELYTARDPGDLSWVPQLLRGILLPPTRLTAEHLVGIGTLFAIVRGLGMAQRPLTLWFVGFRFRVGVVIFTFSVALASVLSRVELSGWVVAFFGISLLSIALARIEENSSETHLGLRWGITLTSVILLTLFLAFLVLQVVTLNAATIAVRALTPVWALISFVLVIIAVPAAYLAEWLANLLRPVFNSFGRLIEQLGQLLPREMVEGMQNAPMNETLAATLGALGQTIFVLAIFLVVGYLLARALHQRLAREEAETYTREALASDERLRRTPMTKPRQTPPHARSVSAESIRRIYAALVAHARSAGLPRQTAETPYEFLPRLTNTWDAERDDLREITEAYVATHYAERDMSAELNRVRAAWERIKHTTKNVKRDA